MATEPIFSKLVTHRSVRLPVLPPDRLNIITTKEITTRFARQKNRDEHSFEIPNGMRYFMASVIIVPESTPGATARIWTQPPGGSTGKQKLTVAYSMPAGGVVTYRVRARAHVAPRPGAGNEVDEVERIVIKDMESVERLRAAFVGRQKVEIVFTGPDAAQMIMIGLPDILATGEVFLGNLLGIDDLILLCALLGTITVAAITVMVVVAIASGYKVEVTEASLGSVLTGELPRLEFTFTPS